MSVESLRPRRVSMSLESLRAMTDSMPTHDEERDSEEASKLGQGEEVTPFEDAERLAREVDDVDETDSSPMVATD